MRVKVFGKRDLVQRIICFRDNKFILSFKIYLNIKTYDTCFPMLNYKHGELRTNVKYISINGYHRKDNALIILIPETEEESEIIHCTYEIKELKGMIDIIFINNWDAEKIIDKDIVNI